MDEDLLVALEHRVAIVLDAVKSGDSGKNQKDPQPNKQQKDTFKALTGVAFTSAAILKQSQIFTGFIGSIFQILGALVDVMLAPLIPLLIPGIKALAGLIPIIQGMTTWIGNVLSKVNDLLDNIASKIPGGEAIKNWISTAISTIILGGFIARLSGLFGPYKALLKWAFSSIFGILNGLGGTIVKGLTGVFKAGGLIKGVAGAAGKAVGGLFGKLGGATKGLLGAAKGVASVSRAIPVLGAVASLGIGAYDTYKAYQKGGFKAAALTGAGAIAGTALSAAGLGLAGIAVQAGTSAASRQFLQNDANVTVNVTNEYPDGRETYTSYQQKVQAERNGTYSIDNLVEN